MKLQGLIIILKSNKILLACIILLAIFTIGAVSAADENITESDNDILSIDSADENVIEKSAGDFSELTDLVNQTASGKTLYLDKDYVRNDNTRITISKSITIDGKDHTIDANKKPESVFYVTNCNVILKNINFINGASLFIYNDDGRCSVYDCSFIDSSENTGITYVNAHNCYFENCSSTWSVISSGDAYNCSFINCYSKYSGGAISFGDAYNCSFTDCNSGNYGGGAISAGNAYNCSFTDCYAGGYGGGAIYSGCAYNCTFKNCTSEYTSAAIFGGNASNCSFINCKASVAIHSVQVRDSAYGSSNWITIYGDHNAGAVNVTVNGKTKKVTPNVSGENVYFDGLDVGTYIVELSYAGNSNFEAQTVNASINIKKANPIYDIFVQNPPVSSISSGSNVQYDGRNATLHITNDFSNIPGNFKVTVNGVTQKVKASGYDVSVPLGVLSRGSYDIKVSYSGSAKFNAQTKTLTFKIVKAKPIDGIYVDNPRITPSGGTYQFTYQPSKLYVNLKGTNIPGRINVTVNGASYMKNTYGRSDLTLSLGIMKPGSYTIKVNYAGDENFSAQTKTLKFTIIKANPLQSTYLSPYGYYSDGIQKRIIYDGKDTTLNIYMKKYASNKYASGRVHITINGESHKAISISGSNLTLPLGVLNVGVNNIKAYYSGSAYFAAQEITIRVNVVKSTPIESVELPSSDYGSNANIKVHMANDNIKGNVWFTISDENNTKIITDKIHIESGHAVTSISNLKAGKYSLHIYYAGNTRYKAQTIKTDFEVNKVSPKLSVAKTTVDGKTVLTAKTAKNASGNVSFEVNGGIYHAANVKGIATVTLPDLVPGTYNLTTSYDGDDNYLPETKTRTITIK